jgi:hypothetical protein
MGFIMYILFLEQGLSATFSRAGLELRILLPLLLE